MASEYEKLALEARQKAARLVGTAGEMHRLGWNKVLAEARQGGYALYGIYASRILAVPHPEVYLQGRCHLLAGGVHRSRLQGSLRHHVCRGHV